MSIVRIWWNIPKIEKNILMSAAVYLLKEAIEVTEDELNTGEQNVMDPFELFRNSLDQLLFDTVSFGLSVGNKVLIDQPRGFFVDFLEDAAFSVLYSRGGMVAVESLAGLPIEINPYRGGEVVRLISYNGGIKLFFGTSEPRKALFLTKKGEKLEIMLSGSKNVISVDSMEYAREVEKYTLLGVREIEKIISGFSILEGLRTKLQWIKTLLKYSQLKNW
ncbi:MAG: hypothetical protein J7L37_07685 [Thermococcus sp.]|nr:hypothetical protein [Thermococcus sp.]